MKGVEALLQSDAPIGSADENGISALHIAGMRGFKPIVERLLALKAETSTFDKDGYTVLRYAAAEGHLAVVSALLGANADVDLASNDGITPLMEAARYKHEDVCKLLLKQGAELDFRSDTGLDSIMTAATAGCTNTLEILLRAPAGFLQIDATDNSGWTAVHHAVIGGSLKCLQLLTEVRASVNVASHPTMHTPLMLASSRKGLEYLLNELLQAKADIEARTAAGRTPLMVAASAGLGDSCRLMIECASERGIDIAHFINADNKEASRGTGKKAGKLETVTALSLASEKGHAVVGSLLIKKGATPLKAKKKGKKK
jgi:ankyrin repeat protein